jgi:hypothetical protein
VGIMIGQIIQFITKNRKTILRITIGGVCLMGVLITGFNIDRAIKNMKLSYAEAIDEYKKVLREVEHQLANEVLTTYERMKLEKTKQHCIKKIEELKNKNGGIYK